MDRFIFFDIVAWCFGVAFPSTSRNSSKSRDFVQLEVNFEKGTHFFMFFLSQNFNTL